MLELQPTFLHNREKSKANVREGRERYSELKSGYAEAFQSISQSNQRLKALKINSKFFFFGSLFLFSCPKKEKVNKEQTISKVLCNKLKRKVRGGCAPRKAAFTLAEVFSAPFYLSPRRVAFTLAEVLITLGIIGVVAAMTLPALVQNYKERSRVVALQKAYSILSQAYQRIILEDGTPDIWLSEDGAGEVNAQIVAEKFKPYLKVIKDCGFESGCFKDGVLKTLNGLDYNNYNQITTEYKMILADGTALIFYGSNTSGFSYGRLGNIKIDIDGMNGENTFGKDVFLFEISKKCSSLIVIFDIISHSSNSQLLKDI